LRIIGIEVVENEIQNQKQTIDDEVVCEEMDRIDFNKLE